MLPLATGSEEDGLIASRYHSPRPGIIPQLGIPAFVVRWTRAEIALVGTDTDRNIAKLLGRTEMAVRVRRTKLKIPAYR
jgi:hypothetical protein